jgi:hypothetical protein
MTTKKNSTTKAGTGPGARQRVRAVKAGGQLGYVSATTLGDEVLERQSNPLTAWQILNYIAMWGVYVEVKGTEPKSTRELSELVGQSHTTMARYSLKFKRAFPEYETPAVLWQKVRDQVEAKQHAEHPEAVAMRIGGATL